MLAWIILRMTCRNEIVTTREIFTFNLENTLLKTAHHSAILLSSLSTSSAQNCAYSLVWAHADFPLVAYFVCPSIFPRQDSKTAKSHDSHKYVILLNVLAAFATVFSTNAIGSEVVSNSEKEKKTKQNYFILSFTVRAPLFLWSMFIKVYSRMLFATLTFHF